MSQTALLLASRRARRLYPRSKGYRGVYVKGARAALAGRPRSTCPYPPDPLKTWRASWRRAWLRGYDSAGG